MMFSFSTNRFILHCLVVLCIWSSFHPQVNGLWSRCPKKCKCHSSWIRGLTTVEVDCSEKNLVRIPTIRDRIPRDVTKLVLFKNYIQEIPKDAFRGFRYLREIYLYENFITKIDKDAFRGLRRLKTLSLHHNRLTKIANGTFKDLFNLQSLHIYANFLEEINPSTFTGLRRLTTLSLHENHLRQIPKRSFDALRQLKFLSLYRNHLTEITAGLFCQKNRLLQLYLAQNRISKIDGDTFKQCNSIVKLSLGYNRLANVSRSTFNGLISLEELFLNNNHIKSFPSDTFIKLQRLKRLSLASNKLERIEQGTFGGLENVIELALSGNLLTELVPKGFVGLENLGNLALQENNIAKIHRDAFYGLRNVATLYLFRNRLSYIPSHAFTGLQKLMELNLGVNRIASIENEAFSGLFMLVSLSLNSNRLTLLPAHAFKGLSALQKLTLYFNQIRYVAEGAFNPLKSLTLFSWNPPTTLVRFHPRLQTIKSNILHCDCNALWLQVWIKNHTSLNSPKIACASPEKLKGSELLSIKKTDFPCDPFQVQIMPNNSVVLEGGGTSFKCSVLPGAVYTWVHNGRKIDMKQADTKYTVQQDGLLEINQVVREDAGTYVCLAENKAGISAASATLSIGSAPDITSYPKEELVVNTPKQSIVLPCKAEGYPKPMIFWVKNDARVQLNNNLLLTHDGSLVILNMQFENEGIYTCVAANTFGKKIVTVKLYLAQGTMCSPTCRRDSGYCVAKYECQCLPDFSGPTCGIRKNTVDSISQPAASNNSVKGKSALLAKGPSWAYEPFEMDLEDGSGDDDAEPALEEISHEIVSTERHGKTKRPDDDENIKIIIDKAKRPRNVFERRITEGRKMTKAAKRKNPGYDVSPPNGRPIINRITRSSLLRSLTTRLLVVENVQSKQKISNEKGQG